MISPFALIMFLWLTACVVVLLIGIVLAIRLYNSR